MNSIILPLPTNSGHREMITVPTVHIFPRSLCARLIRIGQHGQQKSQISTSVSAVKSRRTQQTQPRRTTMLRFKEQSKETSVVFRHPLEIPLTHFARQSRKLLSSLTPFGPATAPSRKARFVRTQHIIRVLTIMHMRGRIIIDLCSHRLRHQINPHVMHRQKIRTILQN